MAMQWEVQFLMDHDGEDQYFYLLTVHTGMRRGAGTNSNVGFILAGNEDDSGIRNLSDGIKQVILILFFRTSLNWFFGISSEINAQAVFFLVCPSVCLSVCL